MICFPQMLMLSLFCFKFSIVKCSYFVGGTNRLQVFDTSYICMFSNFLVLSSSLYSPIYIMKYYYDRESSEFIFWRIYNSEFAPPSTMRLRRRLCMYVLAWIYLAPDFRMHLIQIWNFRPYITGQCSVNMNINFHGQRIQNCDFWESVIIMPIEFRWTMDNHVPKEKLYV
jgi:hypothetical protein